MGIFQTGFVAGTLFLDKEDIYHLVYKIFSVTYSDFTDGHTQGRDVAFFRSYHGLMYFRNKKNLRYKIIQYQKLPH